MTSTEEISGSETSSAIFAAICGGAMRRVLDREKQGKAMSPIDASGGNSREWANDEGSKTAAGKAAARARYSACEIVSRISISNTLLEKHT